MDFFNQKAENEITSCLQRYRIVSNKDTIFFIMQYLQMCYQDEYKLCGTSQLFFYEGEYHLSKCLKKSSEEVNV